MSSPPDSASARHDEITQETPPWLRFLQDWKTLTWPVIVGLLAAVCHELGYFFVSGRRVALGIYILDRSTVSADYIGFGAMILAFVGINFIPIGASALVLGAVVRWRVRSLPRELQERLDTITKSKRWTWMIVLTGFAAPMLGLWIVSKARIDSIIQPPVKVVGSQWMRSIFGQDYRGNENYMAVVAAIISIVVLLSWRILAKLAITPTSKAIYGAWATIQVFFLLGAFAFALGSDVLPETYPIVAFSNMEQFGKNVTPVLIGSDDKIYAILLLFEGRAQTETREPQREILYLPRTEAKWMTVLREARLDDAIASRNLENLKPAVSTGPVPASDALDPATLPINTPSTSAPK
jgi:hypothetical protein